MTDQSSLRERDFKKILLIKLSALGDVVHTIPVLNKLRRRYPDARIDWLVDVRYRAVALHPDKTLAVVILPPISGVASVGIPPLHVSGIGIG